MVAMYRVGRARPPSIATVLMRAARLWAWLAVAIVALACSGPMSAPSGDRLPGADGPPAAPKRLRIGILQEPKGWMPWGGTSSAGGAHQPYWLTTRTLTIIDDGGRIQPVLAESIPSLETGDWRVHSDGTMDQTWRIRPNAKWHDGRPVTVDDFLLGWEILVHPGLPTTAVDARDLLAGASAPDPSTLMLHFKGTTPLAEQMLFDPYPRHILGEALANLEPERFIAHEYWTTSYVAAGPYRLVEWQPGAFLEFASFAEYVVGKPRIDSITVRFLSDPNTLLANILSGDVEIALPDGLSVDMARELQRGWAAPEVGNNVVLSFDGRMFRLYFQHRPEYAKPSAARDPRVRRAFYHTIDKDGVNEVELAGLGRPADSWVPPDDPRLPRFRAAIPEWSYDPNLAQRVLDEAGWQKGPDGVLVHSPTGQRMETEIRVTPGQGHVKAVAVLADGWRQVGAAATETIIPTSLLTVGEYRATLPFTGLYGHRIELRWENQHYGCRRAARPENRWTGAHPGYCSAAAEPLIQQLQITIPDEERLSLQVAIMGIVLKEDYAELPLYWQVTPHTFAKGITGLGHLSPGRHGNTWSPWNVHLWDKR